MIIGSGSGSGSGRGTRNSSEIAVPLSTFAFSVDRDGKRKLQP
jgi:hypothetical protein